MYVNLVMGNGGIFLLGDAGWKHRFIGGMD